jgi:opacity protein-like surface antigen
MRLRWLLLVLSWPLEASAQAAVAPPPSIPPPVAPKPATEAASPEPKRTAPPARRGFQMHVVPLTAITFPIYGDASELPGDNLSARYGWQWTPLELGLGAKVVDQIYLGAYLDLGVGGEGSDPHTEGRCEAGNDIDDDVSCSSTTVHAGIEARYSFTPAESMSGFVGYGFGITSGSQTISDAGRYREVSTARGIDYARLSGGLDLRVSRGFGLGPYGMLMIGRYEHQRTEIRNVVTFSGKIEDPTVHAWLQLGLRLVIFP